MERDSETEVVRKAGRGGGGGSGAKTGMVVEDEGGEEERKKDELTEELLDRGRGSQPSTRDVSTSQRAARSVDRDGCTAFGLRGQPIRVGG
jgi:hypothetical protein